MTSTSERRVAPRPLSAGHPGGGPEFGPAHTALPGDPIGPTRVWPRPARSRLRLPGEVLKAGDAAGPSEGQRHLLATPSEFCCGHFAEEASVA